METRHTPTPWYTGKYSMQCGAAADHIYSRQSREPSEGIARCYAWVGRGEAEANASFIVRACNAHDELVEALKDAAFSLSKIAVMRTVAEYDEADVAKHCTAEGQKAWSKVNAAIVKAEARS